MTSEIAILNRSAVALAADSAVTVTVSEGGGESKQIVNRKIYSNADKLFELVRGHPVGIMLYGSAEILGVPWETIIKSYRADRASLAPLDDLRDYLDDFRDYVQHNVSTLFPREQQVELMQTWIAQEAADVLGLCRDALQQMLDNGSIERINNAERKVMLDAMLEHESKEESRKALWARDLEVADVVGYLGDNSLDSIPEHLDKLKLGVNRRKAFRDVLLKRILVKKEVQPQTGLVFAGFGATDVFPSLYVLEIGGVAMDRIAVLARKKQSVTYKKMASIVPFAQMNEAATFLLGIDPELAATLQSFWQQWLDELGPNVLKVIQEQMGSISTDDASAIRESFSSYADETMEHFAQQMNSAHTESRLKPIQESAAFLSKGELSALAENLVDLASLRNRVSIDRDETVGGATDVAVISKGDGFVWIKRKHYFNAELNPTWAGRQLTHRVASDTSAPEAGEK